MSSYDSILAAESGIVYAGKWDNGASKANVNPAKFKLWNFGLSAAPKDGFTMAHTMTEEQDWDKDAEKHKSVHKSATKIGYKFRDAKFEEGLTNDKWTFKVSGPLSKDDWKVDGSLAMERKPQKEQKMNVDAVIKSPDMSGNRVVVNAGVESKQAWKDSDWADRKNTFNLAVGVQHEKDIQVGFAYKHDEKERPQFETAAAYKKDGNKFWGGYDHGNEFAKAGCYIKNADKGFQHAYEGRWNMKGDAKSELAGQPMIITAGGKYDLGEQTSMNYMLELGADRHFMWKFAHKVDRNWKLTGTQSFDFNKVGTKQNAYNVGFDVAYTI